MITRTYLHSTPWDDEPEADLHAKFFRTRRKATRAHNQLRQLTEPELDDLLYYLITINNNKETPNGPRTDRLDAIQQQIIALQKDRCHVS